MLAIIHSLLWMRHWVQLNRSHAPLLAERVAIVSLQQVAVILASNVGLVFSGCCATAGVFFFFLMVELLFFAHSVFVGRPLLLA